MAAIPPNLFQTCRSTNGHYKARLAVLDHAQRTPLLAQRSTVEACLTSLVSGWRFGDESPGSNLAQSPSYSPSPFVCEFLAATLAQFMVLNRYQGRRWTKSRVADYITGAEDIPGTVSDTTIGRFLDPSSEQEPSEETIQAVAAFLIKMRAIMPEQIELARRSPSLIDAATFPAVFPTPRSATHASFLDSLEGRYGAVEVRSAYLLSSDLVVRKIPPAGVLIAQEVLSLFRVSDMDHLKRETRNLASDQILNIRQKLDAAGGRELVSFTLTGFVAATSDIIVFFLRGQPTGFHSAINVQELRYSGDDRILGLSIWRNSGWRVASAADPASAGKEEHPRDIVRRLAQEMAYSKSLVDKFQRKRQSVRRTPEGGGKREADFFRGDFAVLPHAVTEIEQLAHSSATLLIQTIERGDLSLFQEALRAGADPNVSYPGSADPIVVSLAADGMIEWVEALLATGRCDLTATGSSGFRASYAPGVTARLFATEGPPEITDKFARLASMLRNEETRQLQTKLSAPKPSP